MTREEILTQVKAWAAAMGKTDAQLQALGKLTGFAPEAPLPDAVGRLMEAYTAAVSEVLGDETKWLDWFWLECDMGKRPLPALVCHHGEIVVGTLEDLARVISWSRQASDSAVGSDPSNPGPVRA